MNKMIGGLKTLKIILLLILISACQPTINNSKCTSAEAGESRCNKNNAEVCFGDYWFIQEDCSIDGGACEVNDAGLAHCNGE